MFQNFRFKLFVKLFLIYICVFLIPFIVLGSTIIQYPLGKYKQEVLDNNVNITDYICQLVDNNLNDVIIANLQIMENDIVSDFVNDTDINPRKMAYRAKQVSDEIKRYQVYKNAIFEIDIFVATHNYIITRDSYYTREEYYQLYLSNTQYAFDDWSRMLDGEIETSSLIIPSYNETMGYNTAILMKPLAIKDGKCLTQSLIVINIDYIVDMYERMFSDNYLPQLSIVYRDEILINGSAGNKDFDVSKIMASDGMVQKISDRYTAIVRESSIPGLKYVSVLDEDDVLITAKKMDIILIAVLIFILILSVFVTLMTFNKMFQPFKWIVGVNNTEGRQVETLNDVQAFLLNTINSNKILSEVVSKQEKCINDNFYKLFIQNSMGLDENLLNTIFPDNSISTRDRWTRAAIVNFNSTVRIDEISAGVNVISYFSEVLKENHIGFYVIPNSGDKIIMVLTYNERVQIKKLFEKMIKRVREFGVTDISVCIGREVEALSKFTKSYEDAFFAMLNSPSEVICIDENYHFSYEDYFAVFKKDKLIFDINNGKTEDVQDFFVRLKERFFENISSHAFQNYVRYLLKDIMDEVLKSTRLNGMLVSRYAERSARILENPNLSECVDIFKDLFIEITEMIARRTVNMSGENIVDEIVEYVNANYAMPDLSLKMIVEELNGPSYKYISEMFKRKKGIKFVDFLHVVRINEAKKLLANTDMLIFEIAEKTGYLSSNVFVRSFKKTVGITPGEYRKTKAK